MAKIVTLGGGARRGQDVLRQNQQDNEEIVVVPRLDASPEEWATYVNNARGKAVEAVVEWGRRIQTAQSAYKQQPQQWGRTWEDWCRTHLGISDEYARNLMQAAQNLPTNSWGILPPTTSKLLAIAKLEPQQIERAVEQGLIHPDISMQEIKGLKTIDVQAIPVTPAAPSPPATKSISLPAGLVDRLKDAAKARGLKPSELLERFLAQPF